MSTQNPAYVRGDLIARLAAAVDRAEHVARSATAGPWTADNFDVYDDSEIGEVVAEAGLTPADARHIAACDPEDRLRHVEHARRVMARHKPIVTSLVLTEYGCDAGCGGWPCADLCDLAAAWGVTQ